jgi:transcriptional regulator with XRE-family HTH domain
MEKQDETASVNDLRKLAGKWLREQREKVGISQRELARRVNVEYYTFISQIEAGRGRVPAERQEDWADALEIEPAIFAKTLMKFYDHHTYKLIFPSAEGDNVVAINSTLKVEF